MCPCVVVCCVRVLYLCVVVHPHVAVCVKCPCAVVHPCVIVSVECPCAVVHPCVVVSVSCPCAVVRLCVLVCRVRVWLCVSNICVRLCVHVRLCIHM